MISADRNVYLSALLKYLCAGQPTAELWHTDLSFKFQIPDFKLKFKKLNEMGSPPGLQSGPPGFCNEAWTSDRMRVPPGLQQGPPGMFKIHLWLKRTTPYSRDVYGSKAVFTSKNSDSFCHKRDTNLQILNSALSLMVVTVLCNPIHRQNWLQSTMKSHNSQIQRNKL